MTDRELLELAARAAGIELWHEDVFTNGLTQKVSANGVLRWNPLTDDGDSRRLEVKLAMQVSIFDTFVGVMTRNGVTVQVALKDDAYAATRLAVLQAAAEEGKLS